MTMHAPEPRSKSNGAAARASSNGYARAMSTARPTRSTRSALPTTTRHMITRREYKLALKRARDEKAAKAGVPRASRGRVVTDLSLWDQVGRLGGKLTPQQVSNIIRAADGGDIRALMDLANECRQKDCHLSAVLSVAEEGIAGLQWQLTLPKDARAKDKRAMKWVEQTLRACPPFRRLIAYLAGARYYSFDVNEIIWKKDKGRMIPEDFAHLSHRRFGYDPKTGHFVLRDEGMPQEGIDFRSKWPNKFVVSQPRANGDAQQREGLCRPLIWMTQFRVWTFADWLRTAELSWKPWRIGEWKKQNSSDRDEDALETILEKLTTTGWAAHPDNMKIRIEWPQGSMSTKATHAELINVLAQEMSKCVLGQTETVQASTSSGYAQAKVHDTIRKDIRESAAMQIAADITRDLITPMIALNFPNVTVPRFEFITQDPIDMKAFAEAIQKLVDAELEISAQWVRDQMGMPTPKPGEETIGGKPTEPTTPTSKPPNGDGEEDPDDEETPEDPVEPPTEDGATPDEKPDSVDEAA